MINSQILASVGSPPVFIVSTGRAGSNMLARSLAKLPGVCALHEPQPHLMTEAYLRWKGRMSSPRAVDYVRHKREDFVEQIENNGLRYVESSHYCSHLIPELREVFGARFVFLYRDGRRFTQSGLARDTWYGEMGMGERLKTIVRRATVKPIGHPWFDHRLDPPRHFSSRVERLAWLWSEINGVVLRDLAQLPSEDCFHLPLETIGADQLRALAEFLGQDPSSLTIEQMVEMAERRPNNSALSGRKKPAWSAEDEKAFLGVAAPMMECLGYTAEYVPVAAE